MPLMLTGCLNLQRLSHYMVLLLGKQPGLSQSMYFGVPPTHAAQRVHTILKYADQTWVMSWPADPAMLTMLVTCFAWLLRDVNPYFFTSVSCSPCCHGSLTTCHD
jgi:hypothetical protein